MKKEKYEIKPGKYISFRAEGQERFTRAKTLGDDYTEDNIKKRINGEYVRNTSDDKTDIAHNVIIDIENNTRKVEEHYVYEQDNSESFNSSTYTLDSNKTFTHLSTIVKEPSSNPNALIV